MTSCRERHGGSAIGHSGVQVLLGAIKVTEHPVDPGAVLQSDEIEVQPIALIVEIGLEIDLVGTEPNQSISCLQCLVETAQALIAGAAEEQRILVSRGDR